MPPVLIAETVAAALAGLAVAGYATAAVLTLAAGPGHRARTIAYWIGWGAFLVALAAITVGGLGHVDDQGLMRVIGGLCVGGIFALVALGIRADQPGGVRPLGGHGRRR